MKMIDREITVVTNGTPERTVVTIDGHIVEWWRVKISIEHGGPNVDEKTSVTVCTPDEDPE